MIEVVIDFSEIHINKNDSEEEKRAKFIGYVKRKLNLPWQEGWRGVWDAFSDNFSELFIPEIPKDYKFSLDDDWGWSDYNDYLIYKQTDEEIGNKNKDGVRDDLKLILVNFYDFYYKHRTIAEHFIYVMLKTYSSAKNNQWNDPVLGFELDIKS